MLNFQLMDKINEFRERGGYEIDGIWYPRVTKIVEIKSKPALYKFYGGLKSFEEGEAIKTLSAQQGTLIHETIENILMGKNEPVDPGAQPAVTAFNEFQNKHNIKVESQFIEKRIINKKEKYAGTVDGLASINSKFGVLDIKTSGSIYRDYNLQTSAYLAALEKEFPNLETRWILRIDQHKKCFKCGAILRSKGGKDSIKIPWTGNKADYAKSFSCHHQWSEVVGEIELKECPNWQSDYQAFLGAKKLWEWENEEILKKIGYL